MQELILLHVGAELLSSAFCRIWSLDSYTADDVFFGALQVLSSVVYLFSHRHSADFSRKHVILTSTEPFYYDSITAMHSSE